MRFEEPFIVVPPGAVVPEAADAGDRPTAERVRELVALGVPVLVRCDSAHGGADTSEVAEAVALISVYAWLGARVFATGHPRAARQALDMVASVQGVRPPAAIRRGLA